MYNIMYTAIQVLLKLEVVSQDTGHFLFAQVDMSSILVIFLIITFTYLLATVLHIYTITVLPVYRL